MCKWMWKKYNAISYNSSARFATVGVLITTIVAFMAISVAGEGVIQVAFAIIGGLLFILALFLIYVWLKNPLSTNYAKKEDEEKLGEKIDKIIELLSKGK